MYKTRKVVLIIDDFKSQRSVLKLFLADFGAEFIEAESGTEAINILKQRQVDVIFTDLEMPEMDGVEMVKEIRTMKNYASTPIIMISSKSSNRQTALSSGVNTWISKPFDKPQLTSIASEYLNYTTTKMEHNVLLIDSQDIQRFTWKKAFNMDNYSFLEASNAQDGLNMVRKHNISAIVVDYFLPQVNGFKFARKVRSIPEFSDIPIIAVTSFSDLDKLENTGMFTKVFSKNENHLTVRSAIKTAVNLYQKSLQVS